MKKKTKKLTAAQKIVKKQIEEIASLKFQLENGQNALNATREQRAADRRVIEQLEALFPERNNYSRARSLLECVLSLIDYRSRTEGAFRPEYEEVKRLQTIIMWMVNPKTASQSKIIEEMDRNIKTGRGFNS